MDAIINSGSKIPVSGVAFLYWINIHLIQLTQTFELMANFISQSIHKI